MRGESGCCLVECISRIMNFWVPTSSQLPNLWSSTMGPLQYIVGLEKVFLRFSIAQPIAIFDEPF